jgi:hypothetical protein
LLSGTDDIYVPPTRFLFADSGYLSAPVDGDPVRIATSYLSAHAGELGLSQADVERPFITDQYTDEDTGLSHVYLRQQAGGLEVAFADMNVTVAASGQVVSVGSSFLPGLTAVLPARLAAPETGPLEAVQLAAQELGLSLSSEPEVVDQSGPALTLLVDAPDLSLDAIPARLHYVPTEEGGVVLAWQLIIRTPDGSNWYDLSVPANSGDTIAHGNLVAVNNWVEQATYSAVAVPGESPEDGGFAIVSGAEDAVASPFGWHDTDGASGAEFTDTRGNNVDVHLDRDGNNVPDASPRPDGGPELDFGGFTFDPSAEPSSVENQNAAQVNLFHLANVLHDIHYRFGFTEAAGNFQLNNYNRGGEGNDALEADVQDGADAGNTNNANFATPPDGLAPRLQLYEFTHTSPRRDSSLDSSIVIHEYGHGVSSRLTGGPSNANALVALQSRGMSEGWSDWHALMMVQQAADLPEDAAGQGAYVLGQPSGAAGIRRQPYSFDMTVNPVTFDGFGAGFGQSIRSHDTGEIWGSALWDLNWLLIDKYGYDADLYTGYTGAGVGAAGNKLALKLVMEAMKLQPANPSFTQGRDAILAADEAIRGGANACEIWTAFARRGLGEFAATEGASSSLVTTSHDVPAGVCDMAVAMTTPADGAAVWGVPVDYAVTFTSAIDPASIEPADFFVNGTSADSVIVDTPTEATFHFNSPPVTQQGLHVMSMPAGSVVRERDGSPLVAFSAGFRYDAMALNVAYTSPSPVGGVFTLPSPLTYEVYFNEPVNPATVQPSDLVVSGMDGVTASAVTMLPGNAAARFTIQGASVDGMLELTIPAGAISDVFGNSSPADFSATYIVDGDEMPLAGFSATLPLGSLIYEATVSGLVAPEGDVDRYTLAMDAGQTMTFVVTATESDLAPVVELHDPLGNLVESADVVAADNRVLVQAVSGGAGGVYTISISGAGGTSGAYSVRAVLNATLESEGITGASNDALAGAENLDGAAVELGTSGSRLAALGATGAGETLALEDFESGVIPTSMTIYSSNGFGRVRLIAPSGAASSGLALVMDSNVDRNDTLNEAIYRINLTESDQAILSFSHIQFNDETDSLPLDFVGHADGDGVAISDDGQRWRTILDAPEAATWTEFSIDLAAAAADAGMTLGPDFQIKFQQYDNFGYPTDGRAFDNIKITQPDLVDTYEFGLARGQRATIVAKTLTEGSVDVQLLDATGAVLASAVSAADNVDRMLAEFSPPADGSYYLAVSGAEPGIAYSVVVTIDAAFDTEPNDSSDAAQYIGSGGAALGFLDPLIDEADWYAIEVPSLGSSLRLTTGTPAGDGNQFVNVLDPYIELFDPSHTRVAVGVPLGGGRNELVQHQPLTTGTYWVRVTSENGGSGEYVLSRGVGPTITALSVTSPVSEGETARLTGAFADAGELAGHTIEIDWGPGESLSVLDVAAGAFTFEASHVYLDDSAAVNAAEGYPISVRVIDQHGYFGSGGASVVVSNIAPAVALNPVAAIDEGAAALLSGVITDAGALDTFTLTIDWGDPLSPNNLETIDLTSPPAHVAWNPAARAFAITHRYLDDRPAGVGDDYLIRVGVADDEGAFGEAETSVTVYNSPPQSVLNISGAQREGSEINVTAVASDAGTGQEALSYRWRVFEQSSLVPLATGINVSTFRFTPYDDGVYRVELVVSDDDGGSTTVEQTLNIDDVNEASVGGNDVLVAAEDVARVIPAGELVANDTDPDGDAVTVVITTGPSHGTLIQNADGSLTYQSDENYNGADSFVYQPSDGQALGSAATVSLSVSPINDPPTFQAGNNQQADDDGGAVQVDGWASLMSAGPSDEAVQSLSFEVSTDQPSLFEVLPALDSTGRLTYTPSPNASGIAQVTVVLRDDGGTASGGGDASQPHVLTIFVDKPYAWHNSVKASDVNRDGRVSAIDALLIFNLLNASGGGMASVPSDATSGPLYYDISKDQFVSGIDALLIVNLLNAAANGTGVAGEGDSLGPEHPVDAFFQQLGSQSSAALNTSDDLATFLSVASDDQIGSRRRKPP